MSALIFILLGTMMVLAGLVMIAPQVQVHQIAVTSRAARIFRLGAVSLIVGELLGLIGSLESALRTVSLIMGAAILFAGLTIVSHERQQNEYIFSHSLSLQVLVAGFVIFGLALRL